MSELLGLEHVGLSPNGATLSLSLAKGQSLAIMGPAGAGKSRFLAVCTGQEKPPHGRVQVRGDLLVPTSPWPRRTRIQTLMRSGRRPVDAIADLLSVARLWSHRQMSVGELSPSQYAALEVATVLDATSGILALDGTLDALDPWTLPGVLERLRVLASRGVGLVATTNRPDLARHFDAIAVLRDQQVRFVGSADELLRRATPQVLEVSTNSKSAVKALVEPFEVHIEETPDGLRLHAREGQELAARLLLDGYGDVRFVVQRAPSLEDALRNL